MEKLIFFILICYGLTGVLAFSPLFDRVRPKRRFFHCPMCLGFWVGLVIFSIFWSCEWYLYPVYWIGLPLYGFLSSGTSYFLHMLVGDGGFRIERSRESD